MAVVVKLLAAAILLLALPALLHAAECSGPTFDFCLASNLATRSEQYAARQAYCGGNLWRTTPCFVQGKVKITFTNPGANSQQTCWDALENIISQCGSNSVRGSYNFNGLYTLTRCVANDGAC